MLIDLNILKNIYYILQYTYTIQLAIQKCWAAPIFIQVLQLKMMVKIFCYVRGIVFSCKINIKINIKNRRLIFTVWVNFDWYFIYLWLFILIWSVNMWKIKSIGIHYQNNSPSRQSIKDYFLPRKFAKMYFCR